MDVRHSHGTEVHVVRACHEDDAADLIAVGGAHSVEILLLSESSCKTIANFHIGSRVTAIAWSPRVSSPSSADDWSIELAVAGADFSLYLLSKSASSQGDIFPFGGGLSGHHGKVNDMAFCGGRSEDSMRYVATVSDDKVLIVWDLNPNLNIASPPSPTAGLPERPQPTAYVINFPHPLTSVDSHPSTSKELLVADCHGSIFLTDWRSDPDENEQNSWRKHSVVEVVEPRALADAVSGLSTTWSGSVAWRRDPSAEL
uniref:N/A n=1 Tax=Ganoderma boninense TaxID=34458 RepID=A0A5K1K081_9APHY|nr:N/A [Ganoderma boninense]